MSKLLIFQFIFISLLDLLRPVKQTRGGAPIVDPSKLQIWMVGHATMLINFYGMTILTDPVFGNWLPFPRRQVGSGFSIEQLPKLGLILLSHAHWDHLHISSLKKLANSETELILAKNCQDLVAGMKFAGVHELQSGDTISVSGLKITTHQPHHWGTRLPWEKVKRGYNGYVLEKNNKKIFFCGDSGYGDVFKTVQANHDSIDVALLPIGAYDPPSFRKVHMNPEDALLAKQDLQAGVMIPFHFGTFRLSREPMTEPADRLKRIVADENVTGVAILENGGYFEYENGA